ncbi:hypothetical protein WOSG25_110420 [Weissella oryzae SG25]|uniref:Uncharacterized protein n=1 Tax=Weissella oryzae (strain DSM 25784 / JCM 18191 / LMG 30913 / SG25) TaxID=1329250 RepID=A0A069CVP9_WEIOS|nr:hypothetical protein [Weissella oryzae]GAK31564.1 hypothetical protein WOSG25_110420 [Weissella oryzae SG25]
MVKKIPVTFTFEEILTKAVTVELPESTDFYEFAKKYYHAEKIVLDSDDLQVASVMAESEQNTLEVYDWQTLYPN